MDEYIKRAAARNAVKRVIGDQDHTCKAMMDFYVALNEVPAADVVEVRQGRWEKFSTASGIVSRVRCSVCAGTKPLTFESMPYCPNCGAKMDGGTYVGTKR